MPNSMPFGRSLIGSSLDLIQFQSVYPYAETFSKLNGVKYLRTLYTLRLRLRHQSALDLSVQSQLGIIQSAT